jgi:broad specificity phosphatase PhoE
MTTHGDGEIVLVRHGETDWSRTGRHTSTTDLPLTAAGREQGRRLAARLAALGAPDFALVLSSPLQRARETCELAGLGARMELEPDLVEWNYGRYEGLTSDAIEAAAPGWSLFTDGAPGGESPEQIGARADRLLARLLPVARAGGRVVVFAHGHVLRVLGARWIGLPPAGAARLLLDTTTLSVLGFYRGTPAIQRWNDRIEDGK